MRGELRIVDPRISEWGLPYQTTEYSAGIDLRASIRLSITLPPKQPAILVPTGIALWIKDAKTVGLIFPRSGLGHNEGLVLGNGTGVLDPDYQGEIRVSLWNRNEKKSVVVNPGDRIAQLVFVRLADLDLKLVEEFTNKTDRNTGGFGSSGR